VAGLEGLLEFFLLPFQGQFSLLAFLPFYSPLKIIARFAFICFVALSKISLPLGEICKSFWGVLLVCSISFIVFRSVMLVYRVARCGLWCLRLICFRSCVGVRACLLSSFRISSHRNAVFTVCSVRLIRKFSKKSGCVGVLRGICSNCYLVFCCRAWVNSSKCRLSFLSSSMSFSSCLLSSVNLSSIFSSSFLNGSNKPIMWAPLFVLILFFRQVLGCV